MDSRKYGILAGVMVLASQLKAERDHVDSYAVLAAQSEENRARALASAEAKRIRKAERRAKIRSATDEQG